MQHAVRRGLVARAVARPAAARDHIHGRARRRMRSGEESGDLEPLPALQDPDGQRGRLGHAEALAQRNGRRPRLHYRRRLAPRARPVGVADDAVAWPGARRQVCARGHWRDATATVRGRLAAGRPALPDRCDPRADGRRCRVRGRDLEPLAREDRRAPAVPAPAQAAGAPGAQERAMLRGGVHPHQVRRCAERGAVSVISP
mmetsp:Transcript_44533/g.140274  ORF Transcript_44533/g.140274 Transcript_44533/m.140274 type:complete len:201 (-) Transcript_44533:209-811(-)